LHFTFTVQIESLEEDSSLVIVRVVQISTKPRLSMLPMVLVCRKGFVYFADLHPLLVSRMFVIIGNDGFDRYSRVLGSNPRCFE
jgi:hypothetical protein